MIERGVKISRGERVKRLIDLTVEIADRRSTLQKGKIRINLLIDLKNTKPERYRGVINYLRKGSFNTTDEEIDQLGEIEDEINRVAREIA